MSLRVPFDDLAFGPSNVSDPLAPLLCLAEVCGAIQSRNENAAPFSTLRKALGQSAAGTVDVSESSEGVGKIEDAPIGVQASFGGPRLSLTLTASVASSDSETSPTDSEPSDESPVSDETAEGEDDEDDDVARALAFAKMRAAYAGMSAAMSNFNAAIQQSEEEEEVGELSALASEVISSISRSPLSLKRHMSMSSKWSEESDDDHLSDVQREECLMVKAYIERWANNIRLASTYWQGFTPLHLNVSISLAQRLIVYRAEQAIKHASAELELPPPIEFERSIPRLTREPVHVGFAGHVESGSLVPRPLPPNYSPQQQLEELRVAFNRDNAKDRKVETVAVRLQAGAKRAAGTQRTKEAHAVRNVWVGAPSTLCQDISAWLVAEDEFRS